MVHVIEGDIPKQRLEGEALLKQCLSAELADEIMEYMAPKQKASDVLPFKKYIEGRYKIFVSGTGSPITISVYMN